MAVKEIPPGIEVILGWELVRIGCPVVGEFVISPVDGVPMLVDFATHSQGLPIIRKIEKPKQYRAFASAAEYERHRDRWIKRSHAGRPESKGCFRISAYDDRGFWFESGIFATYQEAFDDGQQFDDGLPFGVEVTE